MSILRTIHKATQDLRNRVMLMVSRAVLYRLDDVEGLQIAQVGLLEDEIGDDIERIQDYGFTSVPQEGADAFAAFIGGNRDHGVILRIDDRRCRLAGLENGEVAIYTDEGDSIILKRNNTIEVTTKRLIIKAEDEVDVETKKFAVKASESITMSAPRTKQSTNNLTLDSLETGGACAATVKADMRLEGDMLQTGDTLQQGRQILSGALTAGGRIVGNPVLGAVEGGGGSAATAVEEALRELDLEVRWREFMFGRLSDPKDKLVLCLPEMAAAEAERANERDRRGWEILHENITKWLSKSADSHSNCIIEDLKDNGGQEPTWVEWEWLMQYRRFRAAVEEMKQPEYIFSSEALYKLLSILQSEGHLLNEGRKPFDHMALFWSEWRSHAFHGKTIRARITGMSEDLPFMPDGLMAAIANTTIYALAAGETITDSQGRWKLLIRRVGFFIHDSFSFEGEQWLGNWRCTPTFKGYNPEDSVLEGSADIAGHVLGLDSRLDNKAFRDFRERTGYGCDFNTMCEPEVVFEGEYLYGDA